LKRLPNQSLLWYANQDTTSLTDKISLQAADIERLRIEIAANKAAVDEHNASLLAAVQAHRKEKSERTTKITELRGEVDVQKHKALIAEANAHSKPPSANESDEIGLVMIENENLKRKIKVLEIETGKLGQVDKLAKKIREKEEELRELSEQQRNTVAQLVA